ncbi:MAG: transcriptional repressor [Candidatus Izemoplasmatales bacterium]|nr:transcriptional repressor [Candidatus Izemoplasmatales bacterium]MDD4069159.1 transcriptional repressor [Candidatus Izemoplasmatales bacterium]MDY0138707.1 transcriptional repressor [Candidatus Izemoplasmatales bacterium]
MERNFTEICRDLGLSPSITRKQIYEYLLKSKNHPTVDEIYKNLIDDLPTLSKTTVYNVINLFSQHGLIETINTSNNEKRYEIAEHAHSHFICKYCGAIYDVPKLTISYDKNMMPGFVIDKEEVNLVGICPNCMKKIK